MSSSTRRRWAWRALGICLLGVASFFSTRSFYLLANRQTTEFSVGEEGYTFDPINVASGANNSPSLPGFTPTSVPAPMPSMPQGGNRLPRAQGQKPLASPPGSLPGFVAPSAQGFPHSLQPQYVGAIGQRQPELSSETGRLLSQLRKLANKDSDEGKQLKKELRQSLEREFDRKHQQHQQMIADLEEQLERARQLYKKREENKGEIVDRRTAQLLGQADDLAWDVVDTSPKPQMNSSAFGLPQRVRPERAASPASDQSRTMFAITCEGKDAAQVQRFLQTVFANQSNLDFLFYKDQEQLFGSADQTAIDSGIIKKIQNTVDSLNPNQFQQQWNSHQQPTRDTGNFFQPANAAPATQFTNPDFANPRVDALAPAPLQQSPIQQTPFRDAPVRDNLNPTNATPLPNSAGAFPSRPSGSNFSQQYPPSPPLNDPNRVKPKVNQLQPNTSEIPTAVDPPSANIPAEPADSLNRVLSTLKITVLNENQIKLEMLPNHFQPLPTSPVPMNQLSQHLQQIKPDQIGKIELAVVEDIKMEIVSQVIEDVKFLNETIKIRPITAPPSELPGPTENETSPTDSPDVQPDEKTAVDQPASDQNQDPLTPPSSSDGEETPEE